MPALEGDGVVAVACDDGVIASAGVDTVVAAIAMDQVVAGKSVDDIGALRPPEQPAADVVAVDSEDQGHVISPFRCGRARGAAPLIDPVRFTPLSSGRVPGRSGQGDASGKGRDGTFLGGVERPLRRGAMGTQPTANGC